MSRILFVDDDALQVDLYRQILEIAGYQVTTAASAAEAVRQIGRAPADLAIMDLRFPNALGEKDPLEGVGLIREIRALGWGAPLIVLSGWPEDLYGRPEEDLVSCIMIKPVKTRDLLHAIRDLLACSI